MYNSEQICEIWNVFADYIDKKTVESAAEIYVEYLIDNGVSISTLEHALGHDIHLDRAIAYFLENEEESEEEPEF